MNGKQRFFFMLLQVNEYDMLLMLQIKKNIYIKKANKTHKIIHILFDKKKVELSFEISRLIYIKNMTIVIYSSPYTIHTLHRHWPFVSIH